MTNLGAYRIGQYVLCIDLLGISSEMEHATRWFDSLRNILISGGEAISGTEEHARIKKVYMYGDTIIVAGEDFETLIAIGISTMKKMLGKGVLAQTSLAGPMSPGADGIYHIESPLKYYMDRKQIDMELVSATLCGPAYARAHNILSRRRGIRFLVDNETVWMSGNSPDFKIASYQDDDCEALYSIADLKWWGGYERESLQIIAQLITGASEQLEEAKRHGANGESAIAIYAHKREIKSLTSRTELLSKTVEIIHAD